ncbi:MAG: hypothetical protein HY275_13935 [Gemmatimonadetes bacterium]|nr:hypothetical protein [Gemmatimonadota bacterium]
MGRRPFVAADYEAVLASLRAVRHPGFRFLEWGSGSGIITILADLLGFDAYGIELDASLVEVAQARATRHGSHAHFVAGSFLPAGYRWTSRNGDNRMGTMGSGPSGYIRMGRALEEFDVVYGYPWAGEEAMMLDLMNRYGRSDALLLLNGVTDGMHYYRGGREVVLGA